MSEPAAAAVADLARRHRIVLVTALLFALIAIAAMAIVRSAEAPAQTTARPATTRAAITVAPPLAGSRIDYTRMDARLRALSEAKGMVGLAVVLIEGGEIRFLRGYGVTAHGTNQPVNPTTVFRWASLSKGVASSLVARLDAQRKLSLDAPIAQYGTSLRLPEGAERIVTVENLLSHRTGIVKNAYDDRLEGNEDPKAIRRMLGALPKYCKPATCFAYQNIAYDAASEIVERVTGESYAAAAKRLLFGPLGMASASVGRQGLVGAADWARPHVGTRVMPVEEAYYRVPAAGGVNSSIFDLGLWMRAQMGGSPSVLPPTLLERLHRSLVSTRTSRRATETDRNLEDASYALGWRDYSYHGHRLVGHRGAVRGYRSLILFDPKVKAGIALLWNSESNRPVGAQLEFMDMLYALPARDWVGLD